MKKSIVPQVIAAALVAVAGLVGAAPAAPASAASDPTSSAAARVIEHAEKTHAAAQAVANKQLAKGEACRELVHQGKIPATTTAQYKCILLGPTAALAAAARASQPVPR